jgi:hypothetical protein
MKKLIIKKNKPKSNGWRPVVIKAEVADSIKELAAETNRSIGSLATEMLEFAIEYLEIEE